MSAGAEDAAPSFEPQDRSGLHNVIRVGPRLFSGSEPDGDAGFDALVAMGVKAIISIDAATPDLERAKARAMRYVHLPVGYRGIGRER